MNQKTFMVTLTNEIVIHVYTVRAFNKEEAVILAQAEAINNVHGHKLVNVIESK